MNEVFELALWPIYQAEKPVGNDLHERCSMASWGASRNITPRHTSSQRPKQISSDLRFSPLCRKSHNQLNGGSRGFSQLHDLNLAELIQKFSHLSEPDTKESSMTAVCTNCESIFRGMDRNEDGSPAIETTRCARPGCEVYLCHAGCLHLSFFCEGCRARFCGEHKVTLDGMEFCADCAIRVVEDQEPECECLQSDADLFDAAGCEFHNPNSPWNVQRRAVMAVQRYEQSAKEIA